MKPRGAGLLLLATTGLIVWSACFVILYATMSVICLAGWQLGRIGGASVLSLLLAVIWVAHIAVILWLLRRLRRPPIRPADGQDDPARRFLTGLGILLSITALASTAFIGLPILLLAYPCV